MQESMDGVLQKDPMPSLETKLASVVFVFAGLLYIVSINSTVLKRVNPVVHSVSGVLLHFPQIGLSIPNCSLKFKLLFYMWP